MKPHNYNRWVSHHGGVFAALISGGLVAAVTVAQPVMAQGFAPEKGDLVVRAGPSLAKFNSSGDFKIMGSPMVGADLKTDTNYTGSFELDYFLSRQFSVSVTAGIPPVNHIDGAGTLAPVGRLANVRYGLGAMLGKVHFNGEDRVQPFIGVGIGYFTAFKVKNVAVADLKVDDSVGPALQAGADVMITPKIGVHFSVAKAFMNTDARGSFMTLPVTAKITLDPLIVQSGLVYRF